MKPRDLIIEQEAIEASSESKSWTKEQPWRDFIEWMQIHNILDPNLLEQQILKHLPLEPDDDATAKHSDAERTFTLMVLRLAIFEAALTDKKKRKNLWDIENQIQEHFPQLWVKLGQELNLCGTGELMDVARKLFKSGICCRKPDSLADSFRPSRVGTSCFDHLVERKSFESSNGTQEAVGPALYRTTLSTSKKALLGAASMQDVLNRLIEEDKASRKTAVEARATHQTKVTTAPTRKK